jgi:hypothetical protein
VRGDSAWTKMLAVGGGERGGLRTCLEVELAGLVGGESETCVRGFEEVTPGIWFGPLCG